MARLLALEWDGREARIAVARSTVRGVSVEHAFAVELEPRDAGETFADTNIGERIASTLSTRGVGRLESLVAVGRASIELRVLSLPPTPDEELPDLVRFQAMRQFTALGDDWPLDFVVLNQSDEGSNVLAATISPDLVGQIRHTCAAGGLTPQRLVLRPFAAASLLRRRGIDDRCRLMVDLLADEADLTVLVDQRVAFMRTVRLPSTDDTEQSNRTLVGETRRTIVAAQNQLGGRRVEQIVLCGEASDHAQLRSLLESQLSLDVELFNPLDVVQLEGDLQLRHPDHPGRFAPLLGMLADEATNVPHTIDFLHPRRKPEPPSQWRRNSLAAGMAAAAVLAIVGLFWLLFSFRGAEIERLVETSRRLQKQEQQARQSLERVADLDQWAAGDVNWLDELRGYSEKFPPAEQAMVEQFSANALQSGGRVTLTGLVRDSQVISAIEQAVRDEQHEVRGRGARPSDNLQRYTRQFTEVITISPAAEPTTVPLPGTPPADNDGPAPRPLAERSSP